jgi:hypothetical protein
MLRRTASVLVAATAVLVAVAPSAAEAATCRAKASRTVKANELVRVYRVRSTLYACLRATGRRSAIASRYDDYTAYEAGSYRDVALAGRYVGYVTTFTDLSCKAACPPDYQATTFRVHVREVGSRRHRSLLRNPVRGTLRVSATGAIAWLERQPNGTAVHTLDGRGAHLLDAGAVPDGSPRIEGSTLHWVRDGQPRSAELGPGWPQG